LWQVRPVRTEIPPWGKTVTGHARQRWAAAAEARSGAGGFAGAAQPASRAQIKKTPDKGGNRASKAQERIEEVYLIGWVKLNTLVNPKMSVKGYDTGNRTRPESIHRAHCRLPFQINPGE
jgi:hypothetical protein